MEGESLEESNVRGGRNVKVERKKQSVKAAAAPLCCPRCESTNTKFCYYNNYSKLQPRHYCRDCRRHWTNGGTLRDVPVGGSQKRKRGSPGAKHADVVAGAQSPLTPPEATEDNYSRSGGMSTTGGASFSSLFYDNAGQQDGFPGDGDGDGLFAMATTTRHPSPASNLSQWDDIIDLVTMELKPPPTSERVDHTFTY